MTRGGASGIPAKQVSCGDAWGKPGFVQGGALGLRAQLEPNKAGLGCPGLESPINGQNPPSAASQPAGLGFQRNNGELGVKDVKAAPQHAIR